MNGTLLTTSVNDALFAAYSGFARFQPGSAIPTPNIYDIDAKTIVQMDDEILNLIALAQASNAAISIINDTGSTLNAGPIAILGYDVASGRWRAIAANAAGPNPIPAQFLLTAPMNNGTTRNALSVGDVLGTYTGLDTSGATAGDPVYLAVGGGFTLTAPNYANLKQVVGAVLTVANPGTVRCLVDPISAPASFSGFSGFSGYSGYIGVSGTSGYTGFSGISGLGLSGYSGFSSLFVGQSGYTGFSGISGIGGTGGSSGQSGWSGVSGYTGYSGVSGQPGSGGTGGTSGYSGYSGVSGTQASTSPTTGFVATAGFSTNGTTAQQAVTGMGVALVNGGTYAFLIDIIVFPDGSNGVSAGLVASGGLTTSSLRWSLTSFNNTVGLADQPNSQTSFTSSVCCTNGETSDVHVKIFGCLVASHDGTLNLDVHPTVGSGSGITVSFGTSMEVIRLA